MLRGGKVKSIYELRGAGLSIREISQTLEVSRNTVRKYVRSPEIPKPKPRPPRVSKLDPYKDYIQERLVQGVDNCEVLLREIREQGYTGGHSILREYVHPFRQRQQSQATSRFETKPGEQAQVDFGRYRYITPEGNSRLVWAFVMVLGWSRAMYVEFIEKADVQSFIRCHINAFAYLGGMPEKCLYDNAKVVTLGRNQDGSPIWNERFLDFSLRMGFATRLCRPYRAKTKGKVERGVGYVEGNFWVGARFTNLADLNCQVINWLDTVANPRIHGTTKERPIDRLAIERTYLTPVPNLVKLAPFLRKDYKVGRDSYVSIEGSRYGVPWTLAGHTVQVEVAADMVQIFSGEQIVAVHARSTKPGMHFKVPGQWDDLPLGDNRPRKAKTAWQVTGIEVQQRSLAEYEMVVGSL